MIKISKGNSRKEYLYSVYTKVYPKKLEEILQTKFNIIHLERKYGNRRIDITGIDKSGTRYLIEISLRREDKIHFLQVQELIATAKDVEKTVIVWCATSFTDRYLDSLVEMVSFNSDKNIEFIAIELNHELVNILENINQQHHLNQVKMLTELDKVNKHFRILKGIKCYNCKETISAETIDSEKFFNKKEKILLGVLKRLRVDSMLHANVHQFKELSGNSFSIGSAYSDIFYKISVDRKERLCIELIFAQIHSKQIFLKIYKQYKEEVDDYFNYIVKWNCKFQKIGTYLATGNVNEVDKQIYQFCRIAKKYLFGFDKFLKEVVQLNYSIK